MTVFLTIFLAILMAYLSYYNFTELRIALIIRNVKKGTYGDFKILDNHITYKDIIVLKLDGKHYWEWKVNYSHKKKLMLVDKLKKEILYV